MIRLAILALALSACHVEHKEAQNIPDLENYVHKFQTTTVGGAKVTCFLYLERYMSCVKE
jgi:hypothetical protein